MLCSTRLHLIHIQSKNLDTREERTRIFHLKFHQQFKTRLFANEWEKKDVTLYFIFIKDINEGTITAYQ